MIEKIVDYVLKIDPTTLSNNALWVGFVYFVIVRDLDKRLNGLSRYIKRYLVTQRQHVRSTEEIADVLPEILKILSDANCVPKKKNKEE